MVYKEKIDWNKIKSIEITFFPKKCAMVKDELGNSEELCFPLITGVVAEGKTTISELHREPGRQEIYIILKPTRCSIENNILRCPKEIEI